MSPFGKSLGRITLEDLQIATFPFAPWAARMHMYLRYPLFSLWSTSMSLSSSPPWANTRISVLDEPVVHWIAALHAHMIVYD